jgi:NTP pyrophosphatase (non-canonical NTP hydrolase)
MTFEEYQAKVQTTAIYKFAIQQMGFPEGANRLLNLAYSGLGLGESGEVQGKIKKIIRDSGGVITDEAKILIAKELGDQLWYISDTASNLGISLDEIANGNIAKLADRKERGVLGGSGDNR